MATRMRDLMGSALGELRYEPTEKRVRAKAGDHVVIETTRALLVWEPRRIVPLYAVPIEELAGELTPATVESPEPTLPILHPGVPFDAHSTAGDALELRVEGAAVQCAAFRPADPDLSSHVILDFNALEWYEEEEPIFSHPRDPFHRIDVRESSRHVRIELDGVTLADSSRPRLLFETNLPVRFYLPPDDVTLELQPSTKITRCPYKGQAGHWSFEVRGEPQEHLAWTYPEPLREAAGIKGLVAFYNERVDLIIDGERHERPQTSFSAALVDEFGI